MIVIMIYLIDLRDWRRELIPMIIIERDERVERWIEVRDRN
jgi:hypothetical protein